MGQTALGLDESQRRRGDSAPAGAAEGECKTSQGAEAQKDEEDAKRRAERPNGERIEEATAKRLRPSLMPSTPPPPEEPNPRAPPSETM